LCGFTPKSLSCMVSDNWFMVGEKAKDLHLLSWVANLSYCCLFSFLPLLCSFYFSNGSNVFTIYFYTLLLLHVWNPIKARTQVAILQAISKLHPVCIPEIVRYSNPKGKWWSQVRGRLTFVMPNIEWCVHTLTLKGDCNFGLKIRI